MEAAKKVFEAKPAMRISNRKGKERIAVKKEMIKAAAKD